MKNRYAINVLYLTNIYYTSYLYTQLYILFGFIFKVFYSSKTHILV